MPVTIGTLTSNVNVVDSHSTLNDEMIEKIVQLVILRLKDEQHFELQVRKEQEVRDRMSEIDPF